MKLIFNRAWKNSSLRGLARVIEVVDKDSQVIHVFYEHAD